MKKKIVLLCIVILLLFFIYFAGTINFYLGSNSRFFVTAFDDEGSLWYSAEHNIKAQVYHEQEHVYMVLTNYDLGNRYILLSLDNIHVELYDGDSIKNVKSSKPVYKAIVESKKRWGRIYQFNIKNINLNSSEANTFSEKDMVFDRLDK